MTTAGPRLGDYVRLLAPLFGLIAAVWALRMVLDAAHAPSALVRASSVTVAGAVSVLFAAILIHFRRFGSYTSAVVATFLLLFWEQLLIVGAIAFTGLTGIQNIFAAPEFTPHGHDHFRHIVGHLTFGLGFGTLLGSAMSCLLLWVMRRLVPVPSDV